MTDELFTFVFHDSEGGGYAPVGYSTEDIERLVEAAGWFLKDAGGMEGARSQAAVKKALEPFDG